ncbi:hypothetical protein B0H17DRAFT_1081176 [Mycena rosella]|uniref:Uncharacterized protein n=1 Tax=Mycena rosella TaxID=1033263 RepID=A0AAD7D2G8_MYCRO|nr:hypothetical protein B0H17DRAFT_1081176 [Mycena rosella]
MIYRLAKSRSSKYSTPRLLPVHWDCAGIYLRYVLSVAARRKREWISSFFACYHATRSRIDR